MDWNWQAIQHAFMTFGPRVFVVVLILVGVYALGKLVKAWLLSRESVEVRAARIAAAMKIEGLEKALEEDAPRKPNPNYSYEEFQRDLHDKGLTFEEIYEKCGGVFPQKPPPPPPPVPPVLPMSIHEIQGQNGEPGFEGIKGADGPKGADGRCPDRMTQLQQWFEQRGKDSKVGRVVPPPPNPYPIIHKIYMRGRR